MNPLLERLYKKLTRTMPEKKSECACCGLTASLVPEGKIKHMRDCELGKLYEAEGGEVEWSAH